MIKLTYAKGETSVWVNPAFIVWFRKYPNNSTELEITDRGILVKETPEEIIKLINTDMRQNENEE